MVDVERPVPGQCLVWADRVELDAEGVGLMDEIEGVVDLLAVQPLILQRPERAFAEAFCPGDFTRVRT